MRGPCTAMKSGPRSPQLEKALAQKRRPNTAKNKKINKLKKKKKVDFSFKKSGGFGASCLGEEVGLRLEWKSWPVGRGREQSRPSCSLGHSHGLIPCILRATKSFFVPMEVGVTFLSLSKQSSNRGPWPCSLSKHFFQRDWGSPLGTGGGKWPVLKAALL